jgi:hypothetical protein
VLLEETIGPEIFVEFRRLRRAPRRESIEKLNRKSLEIIKEKEVENKKSIYLSERCKI